MFNVSVKVIFKILLLFLFSYSLLSGEELLEKYKQIMKDSGVKDIKLEEPNKESNWLLVKDKILNVNSLKKDVFESEAGFKRRKNRAIQKLEEEIYLAATKGDLSYQAGYLNMLSYDAENEILTAELTWDKNLMSVMPRLTNSDRAYVYISRYQARETFSEKKTHPFFVSAKWSDGLLLLESAILISHDNSLHTIATNGKVVIVSRGSMKKPFCAWWSECNWNKATKNLCAKKLCEASKYSGYSFVSSSNNMCSSSVRDDSFWYFSTDNGSYQKGSPQYSAEIVALCW